MIERVIDKRTKNGTVEYLVQWVGKKEGDDDWQLCQRIADIPKGSRDLVNRFNADLRAYRDK